MSISDSSGALLFYVTDVGIYTALGKELVGAPFTSSNWDDLIVVTERPRHEGQYYVFTTKPCFFPGAQQGHDCLNSVVIDVQDTGRVIKPYSLEDSIYAPGRWQPYFASPNGSVQHANGEDWWLIIPLNHSDSIFTYKVTSQGIEGPIINETNHFVNENRGNVLFKKDGSGFFLSSMFGRFGQTNVTSAVSEYLLDRCTGKVSFRKDWATPANKSGALLSYSLALSSDESKLYSCNGKTDDRFQTGISKLIQFDLVQKTFFEVWENTDDREHSLMNAKLGPDGKIYVALGHDYLTPQLRHPYNEYLSVIHQPDSAGIACDFRLDDLSLAPGFTHIHLPNIPNFDLGPLELPTAQAGPDIAFGPCESDMVSLGTEAQANLV
ncbi:MAG: hypothetical protein AB8F95_16025, partial [Bacteroidia bacterium]